MTIEEKYKIGDRFYEVTYQIPVGKEVKEIAKEIMENNKIVHNIKVIPCRVFKDPARVAVSRDDYSYSRWNCKAESQIIEKKEAMK